MDVFQASGTYDGHYIIKSAVATAVIVGLSTAFYIYKISQTSLGEGRLESIMMLGERYQMLFKLSLFGVLGSGIAAEIVYNETKSLELAKLTQIAVVFIAGAVILGRLGFEPQ